MSMEPRFIQGKKFEDERGKLSFNNDFDASLVKRIFTIENIDTAFVRAWQGHATEQRWYTALNGKFEIKLVKIDDWNAPSKTLEKRTFILESESLDVLHIPAGYVSSIRSLQQDSKLLVMADYFLGENQDEFRYPLDYFEN